MTAMEIVNNNKYRLNPNIICIDGPDKVGKSTVLEHIKEAGYIVVSPLLHASDNLRKEIHELLSSGAGLHRPWELQFAFLAALHQAQQELLRAYPSNRTVFLDRWVWSTYVYGLVSGLPKEVLIQQCSSLFLPRLTILIVPDSPRISLDETAHWYERPGVWKQVRAGFRKLAYELQEWPGLQLWGGSQSSPQIAESILAKVAGK